MCGIAYYSSTLFRCNGNGWCCSSGPNITSCCSNGDEQTFELPSGGHIIAPQSTTTTITVAAATITTTANVTTSSMPMPVSSEKAPSSVPIPDASPTVSFSPSSQSTSAVATYTLNTSSSTTTANHCSSARKQAGLSAGLGAGLPLLTFLAIATIYLLHQKRVMNNLKSLQNPKRQPEDRSPLPPQSTKAPDHEEHEQPWTILCRSELASSPQGHIPELSAIG